MIVFKKSYIIFVSVFILYLSSLFLQLTNSNALAENKIIHTEELIIALEKTNSSKERKNLFELHKDMINSDFIVTLLVKADEKFSIGMSLSKARSQKLARIAIEAAEFSKDKLNIAKSLLYYSNFEITDTKDYNPPSLKKALKLFQEIGDRKGEALCIFRNARYWYMFASEYEKALEGFNKALQIFEELDDKLMIGDVILVKGYIYRSMRDKDRAIEYFNKAIDIYKAQGDIMSILMCYDGIVYTCKENGFLKEAEKYLLAEGEIIKKIESDKIADFSKKDKYMFRSKNKPEDKNLLTLDYYRSLGELYCLMAKYDQSVQSYQKAIEIGNNIGEKSYSLFYCYIMLGNIYYGGLGRKDIALKYYLEARDKYTIKTGVYNDDELYFIIETNIYLVNFYYQTNRADEAIKYSEISMKLSEKFKSNVKKEQYKALCKSFISESYLQKNEIEKAIDNAKESVELFEKLYKYDKRYATDIYLPRAYYVIGKAYQKKGDKESALTYLNKALELSKKEHNTSSLLGSYLHLGNCYFNFDLLPLALDAYFNALKVSEKLNKSSLFSIYFAIGKIYEKQDNFDKAFDAYSKSVDIIEKMRQELKVEEFRRDFMQGKIEVYEYIINLLIKMHRNEDAFNYTEKSRARAFLDILANRKVDIHHNVSPVLIEKEEDLKTRIQYLSSDISQEKARPLNEQRGDFIQNLDDKLKNLKLEYQQVLEQIKLENSEYMTFISVAPFSLKQIQSLLDRDTVILEYFLGKDGGFLWIIGNDSINTVLINHKYQEIETLVRLYRETACDNITIEKLHSDKWKDISKELYNILFKEVEKFISGKKRVIISNYRILHYMPFQVLLDDKDKMLVEKYQIVYLPSATILKYCQDKNFLKKDKLLAFKLGNLKIGDLSPLPETEREVKNISAFFINKEVFSCRDMTTDVLYKKGKDYDILHFATHGIMDSSSPLFSSLVFADRKLNVYEIFDLDLRAYLVCLSACKTALGEEANGDELVGLSRAFIYAGTPTICASLWDVSDKSTSELMERFYFYLKDKNKTESLRLAQIDIMKKYSHPFFWAPFVLIGDWK